MDSAKVKRTNKKQIFQEACKNGTCEEKIDAKTKYIETQDLVRKETYEETQTGERIKRLTEKAKIDPNYIWQAKRKSKCCDQIDYKTITED